MDKDLIINNIKHIRKIYNLTQEKFADEIHVGRSTIGLIESGHSNPTDQLLNSISLVFAINRKWLETGEGPMKKSHEEVLEEAVNLLGDLNETEKAFLKVMAEKFQDENKEKANFYRLLHSLLARFQQSDRDTQGYLSIQLKKSFKEYLE